MGRPLASAAATATPERLLDAAEQAFAQGYDAARLEDIAAAVGIRRPSLLYHFATKDDLYAAVVRRTFAHLGAALLSVMSRRLDFAARVDSMVDTYASFLADNPAHAQILVRELVDARGPGREILLGEVVPLLDLVERFLVLEGRELLRPELPVRAAILQVAGASILRSAAGALQQPLWGPIDQSRALARLLLFKEV